MTQRFLYMFGYEDPLEEQANCNAGTDFESSAAVFIVADSADIALEWGQKISEWFVAKLFNDPGKSWTEGEFAYWIEDTPGEYLLARMAEIPIVRCGDYPDFEQLSRR